MSVDMKICGLGDLLPGVRCRNRGQPRKHSVVTVLSKTGSENLTVIGEVVRIKVLDYECYRLLRCGFVIINHRTRRQIPKYDNLQMQSYPCVKVYTAAVSSVPYKHRRHHKLP